MANRDRSQRVGFVYTNIYELYKKSQRSTESVSPMSNAQPPLTSSRVFRAEDLTNIKITKFEPRTLARVESASPATQNGPNGANPFDDLKSNLSRLQDLHTRLRFMLKELEDLVDKK